MKKILLITLSGLSTVFMCSAQTTGQTLKFSVGVDAGFPVSSYDNYYRVNLFKYGIGGTLKFVIPTPVNNFFVTLSGGLTTYYASSEASKRIDETTLGRGAKSEEYAPLKGGLKYYFGAGFYGEVQGGVVIHSGASVPFISDNIGCRAYSTGIGYSFKSGLELGARYEQWNTGGSIGKLSQLGIRIAYSFSSPRPEPR